MLDKLKEYYNDVHKGYRNTLCGEELEWVLLQAIQKIETLQQENKRLQQK